MNSNTDNEQSKGTSAPAVTISIYKVIMKSPKLVWANNYITCTVCTKMILFVRK